MRPVFLIIANGSDITAKVLDRLVSLRISDKAGVNSDTAELTLDDRDFAIALPEPGAELDISMGFAERGLVGMGKFIVDETSGSWPTPQLIIRAKAADMGAGIRAPKSRSWEDVTFRDIVDEIAADHGLTARVSDAVGTQHFPYVAQTSESDLNLLTRLASDLDATVKPASGTIVVVPRGGGETAEGEALEPVVLTAAQMVFANWKATTRGRAGQVTAKWSDPDTATLHEITDGEGDPARALRHTYASEAEAQRAAGAELGRSGRASGKIDVELTTFVGDLMAESIVHLRGIKPELTGEWTIATVDHTLGPDTLTTKFTAERDNTTATTDAPEEGAT